MNITYKIFNPFTATYSNSHISSINDINETAKLLAIEFFKNYTNAEIVFKVYTSEDNIEIIKPYENNFY